MNKLILIAFSLPLMSSCLSSTPKPSTLPDTTNNTPFFSLYKDDVQQGTILKRSRVNELKLNMSKSQVLSEIGSPSIIDPFHNNQWDYINHSTLHQANNIAYRLRLEFSNNKLVNIDKSGIASLPDVKEESKKELVDKP